MPSVAVAATVLIPPAGLPLFWLFDAAAHGLFGVRAFSGGEHVLLVELLKPMYLGLGPPALITGLATGAWRARNGEASLVVAAMVALAAIALQLLVLMTLMPDHEAPVLPFRAPEIALIAAFVLTGLVFAALVRAFDRSRLRRRGI